MAKYRKVDQRIWNDAKFRDLSDSAKLVFFLLLTHPNMTALGGMRSSISGLADEMGWPPEAFREAFREVLSKGMVEVDEKASLIALPRFLRYNRPESPNVVTAWAKCLDMLPESPLRNRIVMRAEASLAGFSRGYQDAFRKAFGKALLKAMPNQEQEQEQELKPTLPERPGSTQAVEYAHEAGDPWAEGAA